MTLQGKTALITGGSRGIGRAVALALAGEGADIAIAYASNTPKAEEVQRAAEGMGRKCQLIRADLTDPAGAQAVAAQLAQADILVHNASVQYRTPWDQIGPAEFEAQVNCNFRAPLLLTQQYAPGMQQRGWGRILSVGSVQERKPHKDMLVYASLKCALTAMMRALSIQLAPFGITVNSIAPGVIDTDRNAQALSDPAYRQKSLSGIPLGRFGRPADCVGIVKLLCSQEGAYITGQNLFVDGGMGL